MGSGQWPVELCLKSLVSSKNYDFQGKELRGAER